MKKIMSIVRTHAIITLGLFLNTLGWTAFLIPAKVVGGGVSGIATLIFFSAKIPVGISYLIINVFLILAAIRILGASFGVKTIFGVVGTAFFLSLLQSLIKQPVVNDEFMATVIGGILTGAGVGIVFTQGGSTGGTDIIAMIINKYKNISPGRIILYLDLVIISSSYFIFGSIEKMVYGYVTMGICSYSIDLVLSGSRQSYQIFVFSKQHEPIAERIGNDVKRGITLLNGQGWYTKENIKILMILARKHEINQISGIIKEIDPDAFISVGSVMGVYGKGFERIRG